MNVREYLSARRAYALVRQKQVAGERVTFEEFAILCHLACSPEPLRTSQIADYQGVLRPTMTHRAGHLARLGLIDRLGGEKDRRSVNCSLSERGTLEVERLLEEMCDLIKAPMPLSRCKPERLQRIVDAMGSFFPSAADLVVLGVYEGAYRNPMPEEAERARGLAICDIVGALGLLQPTVSMTVAALVEEGLVARVPGPRGSHGQRVVLVEAGIEHARDLVDSVESIHVSRK